MGNNYDGKNTAFGVNLNTVQALTGMSASNAGGVPQADKPDNKKNIIVCKDGKSERITLNEGDFKKVKNFDPFDTPYEILGNYDVITFERKPDNKAQWFIDKQSGIMYTFMTDKNDKIVAGAIVEFDGHQKRTGVVEEDPQHKHSSTNEYKGGDIEKEEIKIVLNEKIKTRSSELAITQKVPLNHALEAAQAMACIPVEVSSPFKNHGAGFIKSFFGIE